MLSRLRGSDCMSCYPTPSGELCRLLFLPFLRPHVPCPFAAIMLPAVVVCSSLEWLREAESPDQHHAPSPPTPWPRGDA